MAKRFTFISLILVVAIAGLSQGLTIPLLTILLEDRGVSSLANGFNATALYLGILLVSPFMQIPLRKYGYRNTILGGLALVTGASVLFPVFQSFAAWFALRLLLGIGDVSLHYTSQIWVTNMSGARHRGRNLSLYGLAFGTGFSIGPMGIYLLKFGVAVPFAAICLVYVLAFGMLSLVKNQYPEQIEEVDKPSDRYLAVVRLSWLALIPSFVYGFMEATLNNSFPIYALRLGLTRDTVPILLFSFTLGSLILQLPLGTWSDRVGRKRVIMFCAAAGGIIFFLVPSSGNSFRLLVLLFAAAGGVVGSFYSLGLAFAGDLLPGRMIPTAGIIMGMNYSAACILAPMANGAILDYLSPGLMFVVLGGLLSLFTMLGLTFRPKGQTLAQ